MKPTTPLHDHHFTLAYGKFYEDGPTSYECNFAFEYKDAAGRKRRAECQEWISLERAEELIVAAYYDRV
jgi:hypothetical protein